MERILEQTLLFDFYGELLTEHQRNVYEDVVLNDCSYSEAAQEYGISRQGVHDLIKRCNKTLEEYEEKLHLVARFLLIRGKIEQIHVLARGQGEIEKLTNEILEEL
ncbi:MAG: YlxM family DNA-binding protein [Eubacteriales bacterium]|nr:YlxM family DNA-binding protein [Eubacteriales bacterium]